MNIRVYGISRSLSLVSNELIIILLSKHLAESFLAYIEGLARLDPGNNAWRVHPWTSEYDAA